MSVFIRGHSLQFSHGDVDFTGFSGGKMSLLTKKFSRFFFLRNATDSISVKISAVVGLFFKMLKFLRSTEGSCFKHGCQVQTNID